jgi:hypothetical protein
MQRWQGTLCKMGVEHTAPVSYRLVDAFDSTVALPLNDLLGHRLRLTATGDLRCVDCGQPTRKLFGEGACYKCFSTLPGNDICIVKPELCHFHIAANPCRDPAWGERHCFQPHILYLAVSSGMKVGITRQVNTPTRWIDQGASRAMPLARLADRFAVGRLEKTLSGFFSDRTNWQRMLKHEVPDTDLVAAADEVLERFPAEFLPSVLEDRRVVEFEYPSLAWPTKVRSHNLTKEPVLEGALMAIKGQYLLFDSGVINIRSHSGQMVQLEEL